MKSTTVIKPQTATICYGKVRSNPDINHGVRIYYDLGCIRIGDKNYVNLEEDIHIASVVRMRSKTVV